MKTPICFVRVEKTGAHRITVRVNSETELWFDDGEFTVWKYTEAEPLEEYVENYEKNGWKRVG